MDPLHHKLRDSATGLVRQLARTGVELSFDRDGVAAIDAYIEDNRGFWSDEDRDTLQFSIGAFVGECLVQTYQGSWREDAVHGPGIALSTGDTAFPITKAGKHIRGDRIDSVLSFFDTVGVIVSRGGISKL